MNLKILTGERRERTIILPLLCDTCAQISPEVYFSYILELRHPAHRRVKDELSQENSDLSLPHDSEQVTLV